MSRSSRASHSLVEIQGQCDKCHDLFSVELRPSNRPAISPDKAYYRVVTTRHMVYKDRQLHHRPEVCGGTVRLIGVPRVASFA